MKKELIRIGTSQFVNKSELYKDFALDLIFGGYHEFVYLHDYSPFQLANGTLAGALDHLTKDKSTLIGS